MKNGNTTDSGLPFGETLSSIEIEKELDRRKKNHRFRKTMLSTLSVLIVVAALSILTVTLLTPFLRVYGNSMTPTVSEGEIVMSIKTKNIDRGDIVSFYFGNKLLIKRCIAVGGDYVDIDVNGNVTVNGTPLAEPYVTDKQAGDIDIEMPYLVPEGKLFVMGDHRSVSTDSRTTAVGCVSEEQLMGKVIFRLWHFDRMGRIR